MQQPKLLVVIGATGTQGGSVVNTFHNDPEWRIRGLTRSLSSQRAKELSSRGVEMVAGDLNSLKSLIQAFQGANAIFAVTDFWRPLSDPKFTEGIKPGQTLSELAYEHELRQGKNIFDAAAKTEGLSRLIFSSIADVSEASGGKYTRVYHSDTKTHAEAYGRETYPELWKKTSTIQVGYYLSNWRDHPSEMPRKEADGSFNFVSQFAADTPLPLIAADEDTGPLTKSLLHEPAGTKLMGYRAWMTVGEFVATWGKVLGARAKLTTVPIETILDSSATQAMEPDVRDILAKGMGYLAEFGYKLREDPAMIQPEDVSIPATNLHVENWIERQDWSTVLHS
ncbi:hypothetical protein BDY21DRAFT_279200 [Lineolata rhizophorae]|uniref:NmrA-like domain-containing protein n=1 Tax=Lineolata rhizophorae TaxID=578093 RepID=A0A6A6PBE9_9PEZI|nr:hypothetical protein BDY21DRAFT_279200 [Lineolata rhizophorae]